MELSKIKPQLEIVEKSLALNVKLYADVVPEVPFAGAWRVMFGADERMFIDILEYCMPESFTVATERL